MSIPFHRNFWPCPMSGNLLTWGGNALTGLSGHEALGRAALCCAQERLPAATAEASCDSSQYVIAAKGAVEAISSLCHLTPEQNQDLAQKAEVMANEGLRVMAVARALFDNGQALTRDSLRQRGTLKSNAGESA